MTEKTIQRVLEQVYLHTIRNTYFFSHESDLLSFIDQGRGGVIEFEIKTSKSDFLADFSKENKHQNLRSLYDISDIPNQMYYVAPEGVILRRDIPEYAGLIEIRGNGLRKYPKTVIEAKRLHGEPCDVEKIRSTFFKNLR